jgi:hypothetical protein
MVKNEILIIGLHTNEKFIAKERVQKLIKNHKNIYHIAICYNKHHYLYKNNILIKHIKTKDIIKAYFHIVKLLSKIQTKFNLITFWGHGWGCVFGTISVKSPILSAYDFAKPLIRNKISSIFLWLEGCSLGNIITLLDCYQISKYIVGVPNRHGANTILSHLDFFINYNKKYDMIFFKKIYKLINPGDCYVIYKTKYTTQLIEYLSCVDLSSLNWDDKYNKENIKKEDHNVYNLFNISSDPVLYKILKKIVVFYDNKCYVNIDKFIYANIYNESLRNTYYKILNKKSKKFYLSCPIYVNM